MFVFYWRYKSSYKASEANQELGMGFQDGAPLFQRIIIPDIDVAKRLPLCLVGRTNTPQRVTSMVTVERKSILIFTSKPA